MQTSKSPKDAVHDALWPTLRSVIKRGGLIRLMDDAFSENEWGWDVVEDINTKKNLGHFIGDITKLLDRRSTVRLVLRKQSNVTRSRVTSIPMNLGLFFTAQGASKCDIVSRVSKFNGVDAQRKLVRRAPQSDSPVLERCAVAPILLPGAVAGVEAE